MLVLSWPLMVKTTKRAFFSCIHCTRSVCVLCLCFPLSLRFTLVIKCTPDTDTKRPNTRFKIDWGKHQKLLYIYHFGCLFSSFPFWSCLVLVFHLSVTLSRYASHTKIKCFFFFSKVKPKTQNGKQQTSSERRMKWSKCMYLCRIYKYKEK